MKILETKKFILTMFFFPEGFKEAKDAATHVRETGFRKWICGYSLEPTYCLNLGRLAIWLRIKSPITIKTSI